MSTIKRKLLATLSTLALGTGTIVAAGAPAAQAQDGFIGLVSLLSDACLVEEGGVLVPVSRNLAVRRCCAVLEEVGEENVDFLRAIALANPTDPRLIVLDQRLVAVLLGCQQVAIDRLTALGLTVSGDPPFNEEEIPPLMYEG
ncbi:MAG: hypothetical protein KIS96_06970 [Bauldia sp.]|nr:hypothetical protein [Bauldia sp.]